MHLRSLLMPLKTQSRQPASGNAQRKRASPHVLTWRHNNQSARKPQNWSLPDIPCLEAYNLAILALCAENFRGYFHGNTFHQIPPKNRISWFSCQLTFNVKWHGVYIFSTNFIPTVIFVSAFIASKLFAAPSNIWIGLNSRETQKVFVWSSNEDVAYANWNSGEPNNAEGVSDFYFFPFNESCVVLVMAWLFPTMFVCNFWCDSLLCFHLGPGPALETARLKWMRWWGPRLMTKICRMEGI